MPGRRVTSFHCGTLSLLTVTGTEHEPCRHPRHDFLLVLSGVPALAADSGARAPYLARPAGRLCAPVRGADEYRWRALPLIDIQRGRYFLGTLRGLGVDLSSSPNFAFGPRASAIVSAGTRAIRRACADSATSTQDWKQAFLPSPPR